MYNAATKRSLKGAMWGLVLLCGAASTAVAQGLSIADETGPPGGTATTGLGYVAQNNLSAVSVDVFFDDSVVTPQVDNPADPAPDVTGCLANIGGTNWSAEASSCRLVDPNRIRLIFATGFAATTALETVNPFGSITWNVDGNAAVGTVVPITVQIDTLQAAPDGNQVDDSNLDIDEGSVTVAGPALDFNPDSGTTVDAGSAIVGNAAPGATIDVTEAGTEDVVLNSCSIGGTHPGDFSFAYSGTDEPLPATFTGGSGQTGQIAVDCTPGARGSRSATLICDVQDGGGATVASPSWNLSCGGLAPNVQVPAGPIGMVGTLAGADPTAAITVTNPQDGFTSTANNVTAVAGVGDAQIMVTNGGPANIAPDSSFDFQVSCDNTIEGSFSRTVNFTWDTPDGPATGSDSVQVNCTITDTAPVYESDPAPGTTLTMSAPFGTESAPSGIDVRNGNPNPDANDLVINSATADDPVFSVTVNRTTFPPGGSFDGNDDIEVTCTPEGVGTISGTLTVDSNAGNFDYPLECEGTGEVLTTNPDDGGTLSLGAVPPGDTTSERFVDFTNNNIQGNGPVDVSCTLDDPDGVFEATTALSFTVSEQTTESAGFQCTPPEIASFDATLSCDFSGATTGSATFALTCSGRPLIVPTLNQWGLLVMMLALLLAGGFAARRMMV